MLEKYWHTIFVVIFMPLFSIKWSHLLVKVSIYDTIIYIINTYLFMVSISKTVSWAKSLIIDDIPYLPEEEVMDHLLERPGHPGAYGFMISPNEFDSEEHFAQIFYALMQRLGQIKDV